MRKFTLHAVLAAFVCTTAQAQTNASPIPSELPKQNKTEGFQESTAQQQEQIRNRLSQAGFKNIRIQTESFLVHAEDADGNSVLLIINPDVTTALTKTGAEGSATGTSSTTVVPSKSP